MPSDKPIFFKPEDFAIEKLTNGDETSIIHFHCDVPRLVSDISNTKITPLLEAMEIMREALKRYADEGGSFNYASLALNHCDEILK